ncbi:MAG: DUF5777 family beta-barrel protein [Bacteroidota bacterium]
MTVKGAFCIGMLVLTGSFGFSQNLLDILDEEQDKVPQFTEATFKTTRITFGHSIETRKKGVLELFVSNRFWNTPEERTQSFLSDRMSTRVALEYGFTDRFSMGFGGTTWDGLFDGYAKYKLVQQGLDGKGSPVSITLFQNATYFSEGIANDAIADDFGNRMSYASQLLIARKFSRKFSLQVTPTFIHRGLEFSEEDPQNHFAVGIGGRYKIGNHMSFVSEYYTVANPIESFNTYAPFAVGVNWEIGDLMMQFQLTNALGMAEPAFIAQTRNNFNFRNPNLNFGFNVAYIMHFKRRLKGLKQEKKP